MKCATEFSNTTSVSHFGNKKIFMLLDIPAEEREDFISTPHEINGQTKTVDEMTTRELQQAIKEKNDALKKNVDWVGCMVNIQGNECMYYDISIEMAKHTYMLEIK